MSPPPPSSSSSSSRHHKKPEGYRTAAAAAGRRGAGKEEEEKKPENEAPENQQLALYPPPGGVVNMADWGEDGEGIGQIFSTRRPRDFGAGLSSGFKSAAKGVGLGVASLVAAPAYGAHQGGVGGFFKGLGAGIVLCVALPLAGVGVAVTQLTRGAINTPEAVMEKRAGKKWDKKNREWKENWYSLEEETVAVANLEVVVEEQKKELKSANEGAHRGEAGRSGNVADTTYYDILGVTPDASAADIRKSYYKLARDCHPDKHQDDPDAHAKFQSVGEAYQVLGDEKRRQDYDKHGKDALNDMSMIDGELFFTMLFGFDDLVPYVGRLKMTTFVETVENANAPGKLTEEIMEFEQRKREVDLAVKLRDRIQPYINATEAERNKWRDQITAEAQTLCAHNFGDAMVDAVGWSYENYSSQFLGKLDTFLGLGGRYAKFQARNREMGNMWRIAGSAVKASIAAKKMSKFEEKQEKAKTKSAASQTGEEGTNNEVPGFTPASEEEQKARAQGAKQFEETIPLILETMLNICLIDIEATVRASSKKVVKDLATPIEERRQRAEALIEMGVIFQKVAEEAKQKRKDEPIDVLHHMEEAYMRAAADKDKQAHPDQQ